MDVLNHECPGCGANIVFNPENQRWDCDYCGSSYQVDDFKKYEEEMKKKAKSTNADSNINKNIDMDEYECQNCGARVVTDKNTTATSCVYCGSTTIMKNRLQGEFKPEKIIPFYVAKENAIKEFYRFSKKKWFAPKKFYDKENIREVKGIYIPFWLYDCSTNGSVNASAQRVKSWSSGNYRYTKTDYYDVYRAGNMEFDKVPVDGSTKFEDDIMDSIEPYDYNDLVDFTPSYMSGFLAEKYDVNESDSYERANTRAKNSTIEEFKKTMNGYSSIQVKNDNIQVTKTHSSYVLLPVWLLNINYKNKMYKFAMNGQTAKMVGNVPISIGKLLLKSIGLEVILITILTLIITFLGGI